MAWVAVSNKTHDVLDIAVCDLLVDLAQIKQCENFVVLLNKFSAFFRNSREPKNAVKIEMVYDA